MSQKKPTSLPSSEESFFQVLMDVQGYCLSVLLFFLKIERLVNPFYDSNERL